MNVVSVWIGYGVGKFLVFSWYGCGTVIWCVGRVWYCFSMVLAWRFIGLGMVLGLVLGVVLVMSVNGLGKFLVWLWCGVNKFLVCCFDGSGIVWYAFGMVSVWCLSCIGAILVRFGMQRTWL